MEIVFTQKAIKDLDHWKKSGDTTKLKRIRALIESISETPYSGIGKPEALKYNYAGMWSRRIDQEHRLIYKVEDSVLQIVSLRKHYE